LLQNILAVTLDLDDTLWEISPVIERAEAELWQWLACHYPRIVQRWTPEKLLEMRMALCEKFPHKAHDFRFLRKLVLARAASDSGYSEGLAEEAFAVFDTARNKVELFPEVRAELEWLTQNFVVIAITNGNADLHTIGIAGLFDAIITAVDVGAAKPARPIFDAAIDRAGVRAESVLHVGDHAKADVQGAREAGMRTVWVNRTGARWPANMEAPDAIVADISGVRMLLETAAVVCRE